MQIRLIGVRVDNLQEQQGTQISLFDNSKNEKLEKLDKVVDSLKNKYGYNSIKRAGDMNINNVLKLKE